MEGFASIPYCTFLYCLSADGIQICDNVGASGVMPEHFGLDRSQRPYMKEVVPSWGFLLSDAYISLLSRRPSLTALQVVRADGHSLGYLGADFDLRNLPVTSELYHEPASWMQVKGDPAIRSTVFLQSRTESPMDRNMEQALSTATMPVVALRATPFPVLTGGTPDCAVDGFRTAHHHP